MVEEKMTTKIQTIGQFFVNKPGSVSEVCIHIPAAYIGGPSTVLTIEKIKAVDLEANGKRPSRLEDNVSKQLRKKVMGKRVARVPCGIQEELTEEIEISDEDLSDIPEEEEEEDKEEILERPVGKEKEEEVEKENMSALSISDIQQGEELCVSGSNYKGVIP
jgi:hypothetical protein